VRRLAVRRSAARHALLALVLAPAAFAAAQLYPNDACLPDANNVFAFNVNFFVSLMGEFSVAGCAGTSPVLVMTPGTAVARVGAPRARVRERLSPGAQRPPSARAALRAAPPRQ
jgi:hypothetical protein